MPIPNIQPLLLPVLRMTADGAEHEVEKLRAETAEGFKLTQAEIDQKHARSGKNVLVNRVAWALAHLVMGNAIVLKRQGVYEITERGRNILKGNPTDLTIRDLHAVAMRDVTEPGRVWGTTSARRTK